MSNREQELLDILSNRNSYSAEEVQAAEVEYQEIKARQIHDEQLASNQPLILEVDGSSVNFREWILQETNYQVIAIAVKQKIYEIESISKAKLEAQAQAFERERQQYRDQMENAETAADAKYSELNEQFHAMKTSFFDASNERDDFERKLQAAGAEIESLKQQLESATTTTTAPVITNVSGNIGEAIRKAQEAKRLIYNVQEDARKINYTAQYLDTDEEFTDKLLYIGQYRQASKEEVSQFREEREAQEAANAAAQAEAMESTPDADEMVVGVTEEDFRTTIEVPDVFATAHGLFEGDVSGEVSPETFEEEVRRRLVKLEYMANVNLVDAIQILAERTGGPINPDELGDVA